MKPPYADILLPRRAFLPVVEFFLLKIYPAAFSWFVLWTGFMGILPGPRDQKNREMSVLDRVRVKFFLFSRELFSRELSLIEISVFERVCIMEVCLVGNCPL